MNKTLWKGELRDSWDYSWDSLQLWVLSADTYYYIAFISKLTVTRSVAYSVAIS